MLPAYIKQKNDTVYFDGDGELIYYIPEKYFSTNNAIITGEYVDLMGLFNYDVFRANGKNIGLKLFKYPSQFKCKPSSITKETLTLKGTKTEMDYKLLHFKKGDELVCSVKIPKSIKHTEKFTDLLIRGNLPENYPYDEIYELIPENAKINGFNYGLNNQMFGIVVSEIYRDSKDLTVPFRQSKSTNMTDYKAIPITQVPKYTSPYTAITSENPDEAIASAITNKIGNQGSPLEKVLMN